MLFPENCRTSDWMVPGPPLPAMLAVGQIARSPAVGPIGQIMRIVCREFDVAENHIIRRKNDPGLIGARQAVMWLAMETTDFTSTRIGRIMKRDHSTIIYGARACEKRMWADREYRNRVIRCLWKVKGEEAEI